MENLKKLLSVLPENMPSFKFDTGKNNGFSPDQNKLSVILTLFGKHQDFPLTRNIIRLVSGISKVVPGLIASMFCKYTSMIPVSTFSRDS